MNLISNAVYAMNYKGTLKLSTKIEDGLLEVNIEDDGPGIPPEIQDRIFEPFFTTKRLGEGLGLGLDICKRIVESHMGTIDFKSCLGYTRFSVKLPLSRSLEGIL
jgi:signal transduction histidine kinase